MTAVPLLRRYVAAVPFAAISPYNTVILPTHTDGPDRGGGAHFVNVGDEAVAAFGGILKRTLARHVHEPGGCNTQWGFQQQHGNMLTHPTRGGRLCGALDEPDYNFVIRSAPLPGRGRLRALQPDAFYRWHAEITPRLGAGSMAGFEIGSGLFSNSHKPEADARQLREVKL